MSLFNKASRLRSKVFGFPSVTNREYRIFLKIEHFNANLNSNELTIFTNGSIILAWTLTSKPVSSFVIHASRSVLTFVSKHGTCCSEGFERVKSEDYASLVTVIVSNINV